MTLNMAGGSLSTEGVWQQENVKILWFRTWGTEQPFRCLVFEGPSNGSLSLFSFVGSNLNFSESVIPPSWSVLINDMIIQWEVEEEEGVREGNYISGS